MAWRSGSNAVELRSTGQPRAAVPTRCFCGAVRSVVLVAGALPGNELADGGTGARNRLLVGFDFRARRFFADGADAEPDFLFLRTHLDDLELMLNTGLKMKWLPVSVDRLGFVAQAFHALGNFDERAERGHAQNLAADHVPDVMSCEERLPNIGLQLLHAQRQAALVRLDGENDGFDAVAFLQNFGWMLHALGPAQIADVDQAVDAVFDFNEGAEVGQVANAAFDRHADGEFLMQRIPRVRRQLAHAE